MLKTAENVSFGHPDKVCDQISDAILDECLKQDPRSRVAVEALGGHGKLSIMGEVTTNAKFDAAEIARKIYQEIGYEDNLDILVNITTQSSDIAMGVDTGGAGDQGIMVGYACDETEELLPLEHVLATRLIRKLEDVRLAGQSELAKYLLPDSKAQVTLDGKQVDTVVVSTQHQDDVDFDKLKKLVEEEVVRPIVPQANNIYVNPTGLFVQGGFEADTGLTGRKITADNYGPQVPVGGGAFSGKDATKVDRSAAYMARYLATEYLKKYNAKEVIVKLAYAIGRPQPVMATANVDGKNVEINGYDLSPAGIIEKLNLRKPQFRDRARFGFFLDFDIEN
ncbi:methionine adenosyltransferase [Candidatus Parcubacteria bacterium]|jgi:S-adenosylmethionine synthetase|nr:methionine adenosyltransferase [Candidatus Parcubacteria bacterium]